MTDPSSPGDNDPTAAFDSKASPGSSAEAFLDDADFSLLRIEVDYMAGYEPTADAIDSLESALRKHLSKSSIEVQTPTSIPAAEDDPYSASDIRDLEAEHRDHVTRAESDTLWAYMLVVDVEFSQSNVLGVAYYNTSMAVFGKKIEEISGGLNHPSRQKVEATVFRHEVGHNLGLVNNGTPVQQDHHDEENGAHCTNDQGIMYYAIETTDYFANLFGGTIPGFEQFCTEDMVAQGGSS